MASSRLDFEGFCVEVVCDDASDLRWLAEFLACGFEETPAAEPAARVTVAVDAQAHDRLDRTLGEGGPGGRRLAVGFAGDARDVPFEALAAAGPGRLYRDPRKAIFYRVSDDLARVEVLARAREARALRRALMRVVRELTLARVVAGGGLLLHAAAVHHAGGVVALCGPRRSGKTTLLASLLGVAGVRYVANDRCALRLHAGAASLRGLPTLVSLRDADGREQGPSLEPAEFCRRLSVTARPGGRLAALVFPRIVDRPQRLALRRLEPDRAVPRLRAGLFRAGRERMLGEVFVSPAEPSHRHSPLDLLRPHERAIAERIPCFDCQLGGGAPPDPSDARRLLENLPSPAPSAALPEVMHV